MSATTDAPAAPGHRTADRAAAEPRRKAGARSKKSQKAKRLKCQASPRCSSRCCHRSRSTRRRSIRTPYARPWRRSAYRRADPRLPHRVVPAYPPFGAFGFTTLRHTFATMQLSAGTHFMQVSKWLGHSSYMLTLSTYADYIREDATAAPNLARPVAAPATNVVDLERRKSDTA